MLYVSLLTLKRMERRLINNLSVKFIFLTTIQMYVYMRIYVFKKNGLGYVITWYSCILILHDICTSVCVS